MFDFFRASKTTPLKFLNNYWDVSRISADGILFTKDRIGFVFEADGLDGSFLSEDQKSILDREWRGVLRLPPGHELQIVFRKRVEFAKWVEDQLAQAFLANSSYGRRILLDRLSEQVAEMSRDEPRLLSHKILLCYWSNEKLKDEELLDQRALIRSQLTSFGFNVDILSREKLEREIHIAAQDLNTTERDEPEWPALRVHAGRLHINDDCFQALELTKLPESFTELGMIQSITALPFPLDICLRLKSRELRPIAAKLERKRNLLQAKKTNKSGPSPQIQSQLDQIDQVLRNFADRSECVFDLQMTIGLRMPPKLATFQKRAMANILRNASKMDFCDFEEATLGAFDSYLECIPSFSGKNIQTHTVLGSNATHFLPFFRPAKGDPNPVARFQTRAASFYGIDPVDSRLANYNWLVSGTSGAGKSFFINSLLAQSASIDPNIFIVDIGGSYNKLIQFLGGRVMSLEPGQGFEVSPFFLPRSEDPKEERLRRQHIFHVFLEMVRVDGQLPGIEIRHLLQEMLREMLDAKTLPEHPITALIAKAKGLNHPEGQRLALLLHPWSLGGFFGQYLDNNKPLNSDGRMIAFDLKGLTDFEDLARVMQLIVCAGLWAKVRSSGGQRFSWIVLDEVAFSLLKTQPEFVDELVSTLRKYYAGAVIVVQDLEKVTSNLAGSSILQNAQTKAILQQRGDPRNFSEALGLTQIDQWAIASLRREKGSFSDVFLIRDNERTIIRHVPSELEYWLSTTAPEDNLEWRKAVSTGDDYHNNVMNFVAKRKEQLQ